MTATDGDEHKNDDAENSVAMTAEDFLQKTGLTEPLVPGMAIYKRKVSEDRYKSFCMLWDWRDRRKIRVEVIAGTDGVLPDRRELKKYALFLQAANHMEINLAEGEEPHEYSEEMGHDFLEFMGIDSPIAPGEKSRKQVPSDNPYEAKTIEWDWSDPARIVVNVIPGLDGEIPPHDELVKYDRSLHEAFRTEYCP